MSEQKNDSYTARILNVDLTNSEISVEELDEQTLRKYLGGCSLGTHILYRDVTEVMEHTDPRNPLMIFTGVLGGTAIPGSGGITVSAKGGLTGGAASTQAQGAFGAFMRLTGYIGIVIRGACDDWSYLAIDEDGNAEIRSGTHLVGKDTWETVDALVEEFDVSEKNLSVASIGPAGEHLVRWSAVMVDKGHAAGHNGVGAVMGSKKLKAIAIPRSRSKVPVRDQKALADVARRVREPVIATDAGVHYYGTLNGVQNNYAMGNLPVRNYTTSVWDISDEQFEKFSGPWLHENFEPERGEVCWACSNAHCQTMTITEGPYAGDKSEEPEYEQLSAFSANLGITEIGSVFKLGNTVDRLGLDTNEAGWICSFVMECFEKKILTGVDTNGLEMYWGNAEATRQLLHMISMREGIGDRLAEGVKRVAADIGNGAEEIGVFTKKGGTPRGHDHRARWTELFDTVVSDSGALDNTLAVADLTQFGLPEKIDPFDPDMLAQAEGKMKGAIQFEDSLVTCHFNTLSNIELLSEAVAAVTGWDFTPEEAMEVGRRAVNTMRAFNIRNGITGDLDAPSKRYGSTPIDGPAEGKAFMEGFGKMLQDYYELMGWDENGTPLPETLEKVGLPEAVAELWPDS